MRVNIKCNECSKDLSIPWPDHIPIAPEVISARCPECNAKAIKAHKARMKKASE